jgi:predicted nucleic acid-binding protein
MILYLDASALVKRYIKEKESETGDFWGSSLRQAMMILPASRSTKLNASTTHFNAELIS